MDMHSGGRAKTDYEIVYVEGPYADKWFERRFNRDPENVTCDCCGEDFSISTEPTLAEASGYDRGCRWDAEKKGYAEEPCGLSCRPYVAIGGLAEMPGVLIVPMAEREDLR